MDNNPPNTHFVPSKEAIAERAYYIFLNQGGYNGFDLDHWLEAEMQLVAEHQTALQNSQSTPVKK